jgi:hypothetical protein
MDSSCTHITLTFAILKQNLSRKQVKRKTTLNPLSTSKGNCTIENG